MHALPLEYIPQGLIQMSHFGGIFFGPLNQIWSLSHSHPEPILFPRLLLNSVFIILRSVSPDDMAGSLRVRQVHCCHIPCKMSLLLHTHHLVGIIYYICIDVGDIIHFLLFDQYPLLSTIMINTIFQDKFACLWLMNSAG